ncbi:MAG: hypothetical protein SGJ27_29135 [Candidatus Melainabacteria bacterium]|nr:hypothetical protein [Candidatus Melainabacteria bacterium]
MSKNNIQLELNPGIELKPTTMPGICRAVVIDAEKRFDLTWDRFHRLHRTAEAIKRAIEVSESILDVGGFDGSLALFLPQYDIDVLDPITTGGTGFSITTEPYDAVVSIDALEHVAPDERLLFLEQLCKVARHSCFINFPGRQTAIAQKLIFELTNNPLVKEHVEWQLPDMDYVKQHLESSGFLVETQQHTSLSQWISQYLLQTVAPDLGAKANRHLLEHHLNEPTETPLYNLIIARRKDK